MISEGFFGVPSQLGQLCLEHSKMTGCCLVFLGLRHLILDLLDLPKNVAHLQAFLIALKGTHVERSYLISAHCSFRENAKGPSHKNFPPLRLLFFGLPSTGL